jgi:uncharacterized protein (DUF1778 family)
MMKCEEWGASRKFARPPPYGWRLEVEESKTKKSGRVDLFLRVSPALKKRIAEAAAKDGVTLTDWVLYAIESVLNERDAEIRRNEKIVALEEQMDQKFAEVVALLAGVEVGALSTLTPRHHLECEDKAHDALTKWEDDFRRHKKPNNKLEELCAQYLALKNTDSATFDPEHDEDDEDDFADLDDDDDEKL